MLAPLPFFISLSPLLGPIAWGIWLRHIFTLPLYQQLVQNISVRFDIVGELYVVRSKWRDFSKLSLQPDTGPGFCC